MVETLNIIDPKIMRIAETRYVDVIRDNINWDTVKTAVKQHFDVDVHENVKYIHGALTVYQGEAAVRLDFDLEIKFSLFINGDGKLLQITALEGRGLISEDGLSPGPETCLDAEALATASAEAVEIAGIIKKING
jgi:hypothetical protein